MAHTHTLNHTHPDPHTHTSIQAMEMLKRAIKANTRTALEGAIRNAESVAGFNPPELHTARDMLNIKVGSGQS